MDSEKKKLEKKKLQRLQKDASYYTKMKALRKSDGDAARLKRKAQNSKDNARNNAKNNGKVKERARANAEARMLANPEMAIQIQTAEEISSQSGLVLARTDNIPGLDGTLDDLMGSKSVMLYIWLDVV